MCSSLPEIKHSATVQVRILNITDTLGTSYSGKGTFLIYSENIIPATASYGDIFEAYGTLRFAGITKAWNIAGNSADSDFRFGNFQQFMKTHGIDGIISVDPANKITPKGKDNSFFRRMLLRRDRALKYTISNIKSPENKNIAAAMFFGIKGAVDAESKQHFIKSGTIHLFSVSGLHTGILFAILLPLLIWIPVRWRYLCATILLIPFLLTTGMNIPALRAFLIILFFALLRCCCFAVPPLRLLALGCSIFLIWNFEYLRDAGFLYSFGITAILLMLSENTVKWNKIWNTDNNLKAANRKNPVKHNNMPFYLRRIIFALTSTLAAFAFGSIITLFSFGYLYLSGIWINFFIIFYCPLLMYLYVIQILLTPFNCGIYLFDTGLSIMQKVIDFGANHPLQLNTIQIPVWAAVLFYTVLLSLLYIRNRKFFVCGVLFILFFFPLSTIAGRFQKSELLVIRDISNNEAAFVFADPQGNFSWAFNIQSTQCMELARKFLASKGLNHLNLWVMCGNAKNKLDALTNGSKNLKLLKIIHISRSALPFQDCIQGHTVYERSNLKLTAWEINENQIRFLQISQIAA